MGLLEVQQFTENHLTSLLGDLFKGVDLYRRFRVTRDIDEWKDDIKEIWEAKKGLRAITYSIYFDDEFVCSFADNESVVKIDKEFLAGFLELYKDQRVFLHKEMYKERDDKIKYEKMIKDEEKKIARDKALANVPSAERAMINEVLTDVDKGVKNATAQ